MLLVVDLVEIADVIVKIWAMTAAVSGHHVDELDSAEIASVSVGDDECERRGVDVEVVKEVMKRGRGWPSERR